MKHRLIPMIARAVTLASSFAFTVVVGRTLGASSAGTYFAWFAIITIVGMIGRRGADLFALKHATDLVTRTTTVPITWLWSRAVAGSLVLAGFVSAVAPFALAHATEIHNLFGIIVLSLSAPFTAFAIVNSAVLRSNSRAAAGAFAEMGLSQLLAIPLLLLLTQTPLGHSLASASCAYTASTAITATWSYLAVRPIIRDKAGPVEPDKRARYTRSMNHMAVSSTLFYALTWLPVIALWVVSTPSQAGYFAAANRITSLLPIITTIQMTAVLPRVAALVADNRVAAASRQLVSLSQQAALVCVPVALFLAVAPSIALQMFGPSFEPAAEVLRVAGPLQALTVLIGPVSPVMTVTGHERVATRLAAVAGGIGLATTLAAAAWNGAVGAAITASLAQTLFALAGAVILLRRGIRCSFVLPVNLVRS